LIQLDFGAAHNGYCSDFSRVLVFGNPTREQKEVYLPKISSKNERPIKLNNVFTIEPGIYVPGFGGIIIEDVVSVEESGAKILTESSREFAIL